MKLIIMLGLGLFFVGCAEREKAIEKIRYECEEQGIMNASMYLSFPDLETKKHVKINRKKDGKVIDTFTLEIKEAMLYTDKKIYTHDTYEFIIDGEKPFVLTDVKTKLNMHCPMLFGECRISCGIDRGKMNGKEYDRIDGIFLQKEGYKAE